VVAPPSRLDRLPDDALLAALGLGEPDAAAVFVRRFQRKVYGVAYLVTNDAGLAEDASQQAFEKAWRHAASFDPRRGSVATWLLSITRNASIDLVRVRRSTPIDPDDLLVLLPPTRERDPEQAAIEADQLGQLRPALDALPAGQRRAVLLATVAGRTSTEIAQIEGVPVPTAKTRLRTGLAKLQEAVKREVAE
jgi:RNA polymerase sigma-70 factor (ECF subfamily)